MIEDMTNPVTKSVPPTPSRNRTFAPDGAGGWREVTTPEEMRDVARRILLAASGLKDYGIYNQSEIYNDTQTEKSPGRCISSAGAQVKG